MLEPLDAIVSALPYHHNLAIAEAAVDTGTHHCDLGGNTPIVLRELELDERARAAGVAVVPDCGEAPGMANNLIVYAMGLLDRPRTSSCSTAASRSSPSRRGTTRSRS